VSLAALSARLAGAFVDPLLNGARPVPGEEPGHSLDAGVVGPTTLGPGDQAVETKDPPPNRARRRLR
jgi:hypothetical protein